MKTWQLMNIKCLMKHRGTSCLHSTFSLSLIAVIQVLCAVGYWGFPQKHPSSLRNEEDGNPLFPIKVEWFLYAVIGVAMSGIWLHSFAHENMNLFSNVYGGLIIVKQGDIMIEECLQGAARLCKTASYFSVIIQPRLWCREIIQLNDSPRSLLSPLQIHHHV